jgi:hypothetical protein
MKRVSEPPSVASLYSDAPNMVDTIDHPVMDSGSINELFNNKRKIS